MVGIWWFDELGVLHTELVETFEEAKDIVAEEKPTDAEYIDKMSLERAVVVSAWGRGTAEIGEDQLRVLAFIDVEGEENPHLNPRFDQVTRPILQTLIQNFEPTEGIATWFAGLDISPNSVANFQDSVIFSMQQREPNRAFDLFREDVLELGEGRQINRTPASEFVERAEIEPPFEVEQTTREVDLESLEQAVTPIEDLEEQEEEELSRDELLENEYPTIDANLRKFAESEDRLEIPAGKETREIQVREPYPFEREMAEPGNVTREISGTIDEGIGQAKFVGLYGTQIPPSTFPRTSAYIKYRLFYEGSTWILDLYNDLVFYGGFISGMYEDDLRAGSYSSFREYIWRLREIPERGGPELIKTLSEAEAEEKDLDTMPKIETGDGEMDAPWLERRSYLAVIEENMNHEAWESPTKFLYEELGAEQ